MILDANPFRVLLLGPPASGKGTQGRRLAQSLSLGYLSTGALLREHVEAGTDLGCQAQPILAQGGYLPDEPMCPILGDWLTRQKGGWVLDGFPRSLPQAQFLSARLAQDGLKIDAAVSLEVPFTNLLTRIQQRVECPECRWSGQVPELTGRDQCPQCGSQAGPRADDSEENFRSRYAEFVHFVQPVIEHYRHLELLISCDATASQDEVAAGILGSLAIQLA
jgi:adenylate kinase